MRASLMLINKISNWMIMIRIRLMLLILLGLLA